jgi:hypothetical protein
MAIFIYVPLYITEALFSHRDQWIVIPFPLTTKDTKLTRMTDVRYIFAVSTALFSIFVVDTPLRDSP